MAHILPEHLIAEMRHDVAAKDALKARIVLSHLADVDAAAQGEVLELLAAGTPAFSLPLLAEALAEHPWLETAHPRCGEWLASLAASDPEAFLRALESAENGTLAVLARTAAELESEKALPALLKALRSERAASALEGVIEALGRIGGDAAVSPISEFLYSNEESLITAAARALAHIGTPAAVGHLRRRVGHEARLDEIFVGLLWEVQSGEALEALGALLASPHVHIRAAARQALYLSGTKAVPVLLDNLRSANPDVLVHSLDILGDIGDESAYSGIRRLLHAHPVNPNVRFSAYEALGKLPMQGRGFALATGLEDPVGNVRVAAASAIEKNLDPVLEAGVRNLAAAGGEDKAREIIAALVTARGVRAVASLAGDALLEALIVLEFRERTPPDARAWFAENLRDLGHAELAARVAPEERPEAGRPRVFAVDDSRMILGIYRTELHRLGFDPVVFEFPAQAVEAALKERPAAILTDLNMPEITGIELIRQLRDRYEPAELPIVMVTTQESPEDDLEAMEAGANAVIRKPFTREDLREALAAQNVRS